jgi:hypothetical protein
MGELTWHFGMLESLPASLNESRPTDGISAAPRSGYGGHCDRGHVRHALVTSTLFSLAPGLLQGRNRDPMTLKLALLALVWSVFGIGGVAVPQTSRVNGEFNSDRLDPALSVYIPQSGPTFSLTANPGFLRMQLPATTPFDHWDRQDAAPQLRFTPPSANWETTTRLQLVGPTGNQAYHAGMMIYLSRFDIFYWGVYRGQEIRLERTGASEVLKEISSARDLELKVTISLFLRPPYPRRR